MENPLLTEEPVTLGMRLDSALEYVDTLSSTQLYVLTCTIMVAVSFAVLSAHPDMQNSSTEDEQLTTALKNNSSSSSSKPTEKPKWHGVLRFCNLSIIACFLISIVAFFLNGTAYSQDTSILYCFLLGWSAFLGYFFSFSGISLFYDNIQNMEEQEQQIKQKEKQTAFNGRYVVLMHRVKMMLLSLLY